MGLPAPAGGVVAQQHDPIMPGERRSDAWGWLGQGCGMFFEVTCAKKHRGVWKCPKSWVPQWLDGLIGMEHPVNMNDLEVRLL